MPQPPQLLSSLRRSVSQPLESIPSQLPQPTLQLWMWQLSPEQEAVALFREQVVPQDPQLESESSVFSQPLPQLPSQLPQPLLHRQVLEEQ